MCENTTLLERWKMGGVLSMMEWGWGLDPSSLSLLIPTKKTERYVVLLHM